MRVAIISDLHSNVEAFDTVWGLISDLSVERTYCLGDIVGYGPNPLELVKKVKENVHACVLGNHDEAVLKEPRYFNRIPYEAIMWTRVQFSYGCEEDLAYLRSLPTIIREDGMVFTHGLLDNNMCYVDNTDDLMLIYEGMGPDDFICFGGHSHYPSVWVLEGNDIYPIDLNPGESFQFGEHVDKVWVNVGSVGQPRDGDARSSFMVYDTESRSVEYHRLDYPYKQTMAKIRKVPELDNYLSERLEKGV